MAEKQYDLSKFRLKRILTNSSKAKTICVLGTFPSSNRQSDNVDDKSVDQAIVLLEKTPFVDADVSTGSDSVDHESCDNDTQRKYFSSNTTLKCEFINDIYGNFQCYPKPEINSVKATIICPCTEKHIQKYSSQAIRIVQETPELYKNVTEPRLELQKEIFNLDWVYNILDHKKEAERIIFEDPSKELGFVLLPDLKWDGKTLETFYALAIVHKLNLKSLRSLTADHLPLLRNIREKGLEAIKEKYKLERSQIRIYFHYQPSFYHLHVHFTYLKHEAPGIYCEKSHLLDTVIDNIELMSDYYQKGTLSFVLNESDAYIGKYIPELASAHEQNNKISNEAHDVPSKRPKLD